MLVLWAKTCCWRRNRDVYELLDLGIARCRMSVIALPDWTPVMNPRVATKYPNIASQFFREQGQQVEVIKLNGLVEHEEMFPITSRFIANRVSYRLKNKRIEEICRALEQVIPKENQC